MLRTIPACLTLMLGFIMTTLTLNAQTIVYVTPTGAGAMDGTSWSNARSGAMLPAVLRDQPGFGMGTTQVWVAAGTYHPHATIRDSSFTFAQNVAAYGGFAGNETSLTQRDWNANITILSGDIGMSGVNTDNSYHVVKFEIAGSSGVDGFTISDGNANDPVNFYQQFGGGISNICYGTPAYTSVPFIRNCKLINNNAIESGGALYNTSLAGDAAPVISNCVFANNTAQNNGAAIYSTSSEPYGGWEGITHLYIDHTQFLNNKVADTSNGMGGAIHFGSGGSSSYGSITGCTFSGNISGYGGAISHMMTNYTQTAYGDFSLDIDSSDFIRNKCGQGSGTAIINMGGPFLTGHMNISNSTFSENTVLDTNGVGICIRTASVAMDERDRFTNCRFLNNGRGYSPYGRWSIYSAADSGRGVVPIDSLIITNSLFVNNGYGGDLMTGASNGARHITVFTNNTVFHDSTNLLGNTFDNSAGINDNMVHPGTEASLFIQNSILWRDMPVWAIGAPVEIYNEVYGGFTPASASHSKVTNSIVTSVTTPWPVEYGINGGGNLGVRPQFADTAALDYHLVCGAPGVNAGSNGLYPSALSAKDLAGNVRINNNTIDIGAFETYPVLPNPHPVLTTSALTLTYTNTAFADSVIWTFGDGTTAIQNTGTHTYMQPGVYTVCLHLVNGCGAADSCMSVSFGTTGISDISSYQAVLKCWPNPANGDVTIDVPMAGVLTITNATGQLIRSLPVAAGRQQLDLSTYSPGIYLIRLRDDSGRNSQIKLLRQ